MYISNLFNGMRRRRGNIIEKRVDMGTEGLDRWWRGIQNFKGGEKLEKD